jgi:hypothetical protein
MACISTMDVQTRIDLHELLSRFCLRLDGRDNCCWSTLFCTDAVVQWGNAPRMTGREEIAAGIGRMGHPGQRHLFSSVVFDRTSSPREILCTASCLVSDWAAAGALSDFLDCSIIFRKAGALHIASVTAVSAKTASIAAMASRTAGLPMSSFN